MNVPLHEALEAALSGAPLTDCLAVPTDRITAVRARAEALFDAGKWRDCVTALETLALLGDVGPFDALARARCHTELGEPDLALRWGEVAQATLTALEEALGKTGDDR